MNYHLTIVLLSTFDREQFKDNYKLLRDCVLKHFSPNIEGIDQVLELNSSQCMVESNQRFTIYLDVKLKEGTNLEELKEKVFTYVPEQLDIITFKVADTKVHLNRNAKQDLLDSDNVGFLTSLEQIPSEVKSIQFAGVVPATADGKPEVKINFLDNDNNTVSVSAPWVQPFKDAFSETFTASEIFGLKLSYVARLLIGKNPTQEIFDAIDSTLMITTKGMERSKKEWKDCRLCLDYSKS